MRAFGEVDDRQLKALAQGVTVDGIAYGPIEAQLDRTQGDNAWLTLSLREGKNREVRRVLEHVGLSVNRLIRMAYGPFQLGRLPKRSVEEVLGQGAARADRRLWLSCRRARGGPRRSRRRVSLRIIAGRHRGRRIETPTGLATRPTSDRAREALFAILEHGQPPLRGCRFLDLFAGSGAAGAGGRVARRRPGPVHRPGQSPPWPRSGATSRRLARPSGSRSLRADACRLGPAPSAFDIVFLDPPYGSGLAAACAGQVSPARAGSRRARESWPRSPPASARRSRSWNSRSRTSARMAPPG